MPRFWIVAGLAVAASAAGAAPVGPALDAKPAPDAEGAYAETCAYCHGSGVGPIILGRHLPG